MGVAERETRIWLVRHAPVQGPRGVIHAHDALADLSDEAALAALRSALPPGAAAWCSPARRTRDTARALGLDATPLDDFREQEFGAWTGLRHDDLAVSGDPAYAAFWSAPASNAPPGGESFAEQIRRAADGLARLPAGDAIVVAHSGTVRAALAVALDMAAEGALRFVVDPLSVTRIDRLATAWRVIAVNQLYLTAPEPPPTVCGDGSR